MKKSFDIRSWVDTPEKRFQIIRIGYLVALAFTVLGFILIIMHYLYP